MPPKSFLMDLERAHAPFIDEVIASLHAHHHDPRAAKPSEFMMIIKTGNDIVERQATYIVTVLDTKTDRFESIRVCRSAMFPVIADGLPNRLHIAVKVITSKQMVQSIALDCSPTIGSDKTKTEVLNWIDAPDMPKGYVLSCVTPEGADQANLSDLLAHLQEISESAWRKSGMRPDFKFIPVSEWRK